MRTLACVPNRQTANLRTPANVLDNFFDDFIGRSYPIFHQKRNVVQHRATDIYEEENSVVFELEMAGVRKEDVSISSKGKVLTISVDHQKKTEEIQEDETRKYYRRERHCQSFERSFNLAFEIDSKEVSAKLDDGILVVKVGRPEAQLEQEIKIQ